MPIFSKKFTFKSAPVRNRRIPESDCPRIHEKLEEFRNIQLQLGIDGGYTFANGSWTSTEPSSAIKPSTNPHPQLKQQITKLSEENNFLKLKVDIMIDLLTENSIELKELRENISK
ncbi:hypothetical protein DMENIID0001_134300 [Sergentomyia squamirostris]